MNDVIELERAETVAVADRPQHAVAHAQPRNTGTVAPADLLRYALDSGADLDRLEKLMELQDRHEANKARMAFVDAMAEFKKNAPQIYKDKNVSFTGTSYNHATLGGICEVVIASLASHGISHDWNTEQPPSGMIKVTCTLTHSLGHSKATSMEAPPDNSGKKNGIQQIASTVTYLQRYTLLGACGLATKDMDDDAQGGAQEPSLTRQNKQATASEPPAELLSLAQAAAKAGLAAYQHFFSGAGVPSRKALAAHHEALKATAEAADRQRSAATAGAAQAAKPASAPVSDEIAGMAADLLALAEEDAALLSDAWARISKATQDRLSAASADLKKHVDAIEAAK